jgi:hypothetical protein
LAVTAVVDGEDVQVLPVQGCDGVYSVAQVAVRAVEEQNGSLCFCVGNPPAGELGGTGFGDDEFDGFVGESGAGWGAGDG